MISMKKLLLVNPPYESFGGIKDSGGHALPLNLAYLAAHIRDKIDLKIDILDAEVLGLSYKGIYRVIRRLKPDFVGITCPTPAFNHVIMIARMVKRANPDGVVVVGGPHPTTFPENVAKVPYVDFVVRGEGEITFLELLKELIDSKRKKRKNFNKEIFGKIKGIAFSLNSKVIMTPERKLIGDLDSIPFPARDLFDLDMYYSAATKKVSDFKSTSIMTSRGCPYDCIHCISKLVWKRRVRYRSVKNIVDEIEECVNKYGMREFNFYDDTFTINKRRVIEVCEEINRRKLKIVWICFARVNTVDREMLKAMKSSGCKKISFGLESGSQKILDLMRKNSTPEMGRKAVTLAKKEGLDVHASFMFGNVGETVDTIKKTISFAKSLNLDNATFFITAPFPGTELYNIAKKNGYINEETKWEDFAPITLSAPVLIQKNIGQKDLVKWQKKAFREFYMRPKYVWRKIRNISSWGDIKTLMEGFLVFLRLAQKK